MEEMKPEYILDNLKSNDYDIKNYPLRKCEADHLIMLLEKEIEERKEEDDLK